MQNQYPHVIKSQKPKQSNAWRSNSVPNVYKNLNHRVNNFSSFQSRQCGNVWVKCWYTVCRGNGIVSSMDLVNIVIIGSELYSGLSSLSRQS